MPLNTTSFIFFFFNDPPTTEIYPFPLPDPLPISHRLDQRWPGGVELFPEVADVRLDYVRAPAEVVVPDVLEDLRLRQDASRIEHEEAEQRELGSRSEEHTSELQSPCNLVCRLLLE